MNAGVLVHTVQHHRYVTLSYLLYDLKVSNRPAFSTCLMPLQQFDACKRRGNRCASAYHHEGLWSSSGHVAVCTIVLLALRPLSQCRYFYSFSSGSFFIVLHKQVFEVGSRDMPASRGI